MEGVFRLEDITSSGRAFQVGLIVVQRWHRRQSPVARVVKDTPDGTRLKVRHTAEGGASKLIMLASTLNFLDEEAIERLYVDGRTHRNAPRPSRASTDLHSIRGSDWSPSVSNFLRQNSELFRCLSQKYSDLDTGCTHLMQYLGQLSLLSPRDGKQVSLFGLSNRYVASHNFGEQGNFCGQRTNFWRAAYYKMIAGKMVL